MCKINMAPLPLNDIVSITNILEFKSKIPSAPPQILLTNDVEPSVTDGVRSPQSCIKSTTSVSNSLKSSLLQVPSSPIQPSIYSDYSLSFSKTLSSLESRRPSDIRPISGYSTFLPGSNSASNLIEDDPRFCIFSQRIMGDVQYITDFLDQWEFVSLFYPLKIGNAILRSLGAPLLINNPFSGVFIAISIILESPYVALWGFGGLFLSLTTALAYFEQKQHISNGRIGQQGLLLGLLAGHCASITGYDLPLNISITVILIIARYKLFKKIILIKLYIQLFFIKFIMHILMMDIFFRFSTVFF